MKNHSSDPDMPLFNAMEIDMSRPPWWQRRQAAARKGRALSTTDRHNSLYYRCISTQCACTVTLHKFHLNTAGINVWKCAECGALDFSTEGWENSPTAFRAGRKA